MADERILHGLIQLADISASTIEFTIRKGDGRWVVWRVSPIGWVWAAEFADRLHAEDFLLSQLTQEER